MCGMSYTATYIPTTFASMWLYSKFAPRQVTRLACFITVSGCWIRSLCEPYNSFHPIMSGEIWLSLGYPLFCNSTTQFCNAWFPDGERTLATALCGLCIPLGNLVAFIMSGLIFSGVSNDDYAAIKAAVVKMIWI